MDITSYNIQYDPLFTSRPFLIYKWVLLFDETRDLKFA